MVKLSGPQTLDSNRFHDNPRVSRWSWEDKEDQREGEEAAAVGEGSSGALLCSAGCAPCSWPWGARCQDPGDKNLLLLFLSPLNPAVRISGAWGHRLSCPKNNTQRFLSANVSSMDLKRFCSEEQNEPYCAESEQSLIMLPANPGSSLAQTDRLSLLPRSPIS